jgi:hypothetical protein
MKCPKCSGTLPTVIMVKSTPVHFEFGMRSGNDGLLQRTTEITAVEDFNFEILVAGSHFSTCPLCHESFDVSTIVVIPVCTLCNKEYSQLNKVDNHCAYNGLVCLNCARTNLTKMCRDCSRQTKCKLYSRTLKAATKGE